MASGKVVAYLRVSAKRRAGRGLDLAGQQAALRAFLDGGGRSLAGEFTEVENGGKGDADRQQLRAALAACRVHRATLVVAKLGRLRRDPSFLAGLEDSGVDFVCADVPGADRLTVGAMALAAQEERRAASARVKAALAAAKARGVVLGSPQNLANRALGTARGNAALAKLADERAALLRPIVADLRAGGAKSLREVAEALNARGVTAPRGGRWTPEQLCRTLARE